MDTYIYLYLNIQINHSYIQLLQTIQTQPTLTIKKMSRQQPDYSKYQQSPKLFITNLPPDLPQDQLKSDIEPMFQKFGVIKNINVKKHKSGQYSYCFLEYEKIQDGIKAIQEMDQTMVHQRPMKVRQDRQGDGCFNCKKSGHFAKDCPQGGAMRSEHRKRRENNNYQHYDDYRNQRKHRRPRQSRSNSYDHQSSKRRRRQRSRSKQYSPDYYRRERRHRKSRHSRSRSRSNSYSDSYQRRRPKRREYDRDQRDRRDDRRGQRREDRDEDQRDDNRRGSRYEKHYSRSPSYEQRRGGR